MASSATSTGSPRILGLVVKHIGSLEFMIPLLVDLRERHPGAEIVILLCAHTRSMMLRGSGFYESVARRHAIRIADLCDTVSGRRSVLAPLARMACLHGWSDHVERTSPVGKAAARMEQAGQGFLLKVLETADPAAFVRHFRPDIVLFGNMGAEYPGRQALLDALEDSCGRLFLVPHAPTYYQLDDFVSYDKTRGDVLPARAEYWNNFPHSRPDLRMPAQAGQFHYTGYPGLDAAWLRRCRPAGVPSSRRLKCLFLIRMFTGLGSGRSEKSSPEVYDGEEMARIRDVVAGAINTCGRDVEVIIKPHPANNYRTLAAAFKGSFTGPWRVSYESVYGLLRDCDLVISLWTTALFMPAMAGVPVLLLNSSVQQYIHGRWDVMRDLYTGLQHYLQDPQELPERLSSVLGTVDKQRAEGRPLQGPDVAYLRQYFPEGAMQRCRARLGL
jgi:hypothetical protein